MRLSGKVALVTGAASEHGIGRAIALAFAREGARLALVDVHTCEAVVAAAERAGGEAIALQADVAVSEQVEAAVAATIARFGRIDVLVNNAGFCEFRAFLDLDETLWDQTFAVNVKGYFLFGQAVARHMLKRGAGGRIINISSVSAEYAGEWKVHYCASKAAVKLLTQGMALELARHGINVNAIAPGTVDTEIVKHPEIQRLVAAERERSTAPVGRIEQPEDLVGAAIFLASAESEYVTGSTILVDGGSSAGTLLPTNLMQRGGGDELGH